ncbi:MAG: HIT domain-containing protein [Pseudomonadota bacterium]
MTETGNWQLDPRIAAEAKAAMDLPLCRVLLRNEARFPWLVLVPRRAEISESFELDAADRAQLWAEVDQAAAALKTVTGAEKINIAAFGNMVPQLHVHIVARTSEDPAWPGSAVGWATPEPYSEDVPSFWPDLLAALARSAR